MNLFEIGRRLKHVKETKLAERHGGWTEWCENYIEIPVRHANKFVTVYEQLADKWSTSTTLPFEALYQIATLPPDERDCRHTIPSSGDTKTVDEMTVRELREVKAELKRQRERAEPKRQAKREQYSSSGIDQSALNARWFYYANVNGDIRIFIRIIPFILYQES